MKDVGLMPSSSMELVDSIIRSYGQLQTSRYMAIAALTLLVYDWLTTLDKEAEFIWGKRWSFARVVYHLNRILPLLLFSVILIPNILFAPPHYTATMCKRIILCYSYGVVALLAILCVTSIIRCWALYGQKWVLWLLVPALFLTVGHALAQVTLNIGNTFYLANPLPGVLEGCFVVLPSNIWLAYLSGVLYETLVFGLLVWRIWRLSSGFGLTPLMKQLLKHGASFFAVNFGLMLISCIGSGYSKTIVIVNVSGALTALSSIMCSHIFFSMHEFACLGGIQGNAVLPATEPTRSSGSDRLSFAMQNFGSNSSRKSLRISLGAPAHKYPDSNLLNHSWTRSSHKVPV